MQHKALFSRCADKRLAAQVFVILLWICDVCEASLLLVHGLVTKCGSSPDVVSSSSSGEQSAIIGINCS